MKKHLSLTKHFMCAGTLIFACLLQGCEKKDDLQNYSIEIIANSSEFEDYIIAAVDYECSQNIFIEEMSKVDFLNLGQYEKSIDLNGNEVINLPISVCIEDKFNVLTRRREIFLQSYPQFISFDETKQVKYFEFCIKNSVKINNAFLEFGVDPYLPITRQGFVESFNNQSSMMYYLPSWMNNLNYVEAGFVVHQSGRISMVVDPRNTATDFYITLQTDTTTNPYTHYYFDGGDTTKAINIIHTHQYSPVASPRDTLQALSLPELNHFVYYNGRLYQFP